MPRPVRIIRYAVLLVLVGAGGYSASVGSDWRTASREPVGLAPDPADVDEAMVQVYGARTVGAKGLFGVHTWVAVKATGAPAWTVYEVMGWRLRWSESAVVGTQRQPDRRWYGAEPELYVERRGAGVDAMIERIEQAVRSYPYAAEYRVWPGPNSNTFTAWISRAVPQLELDLPSTAIGKDYLGSSMFASAPSGHGVQLSLGGLLGVAVSAVDGLEINLLGLNFGISPGGVKLPMVGFLGPRARPATSGTAEPASAYFEATLVPTEPP